PKAPLYFFSFPFIFIAAILPEILAVEPIGDQAGFFVILLDTVAQSPTAYISGILVSKYSLTFTVPFGIKSMPVLSKNLVFALIPIDRTTISVFILCLLVFTCLTLPFSPIIESNLVPVNTIILCSAK